MVRRENYVNKIRALGYTFKSQQKRTYLWRKTGGTHFIAVPMADLLEDEFVLSTLRQAGCKDDEIHTFIAACKA